MEHLYNNQPLNKEYISCLNFPKEDLNLSNEEKKNILDKLKIASILGNTEKLKCKVYFVDDISAKFVHTTIWAVCEKYIVLKYGMIVPIYRIFDIKY